jgi:hypothetical protein
MGEVVGHSSMRAKRFPYNFACTVEGSGLLVRPKIGRTSYSPLKYYLILYQVFFYNCLASIAGLTHLPPLL